MVIRNAWTRLTHKQLLVLYPFVLGILNSLAFLAIYVAAEDLLTWNGYARANFDRFPYLRDELTSAPDGAVVITAGTAGVLIVLLTAAIRAPYFRAIVGLGYPLAPASRQELARLTILYLVIYGLLAVLPGTLPADSTAFGIASLVLFAAGIIFLFADYALVFEGIGPLQAVRRSLQVLEMRLVPSVALYLGGALLWLGVDSLYRGYFEEGDSVFVLLPISHLLLNALVTLLLDTLLVFLYFDSAKEIGS
ncbi:MAG: hypothetical protein Kow00129_00630 [Thermoleophilia bacterium]